MNDPFGRPNMSTPAGREHIANALTLLARWFDADDARKGKAGEDHGVQDWLRDLAIEVLAKGWGRCQD